MEHMQQLSSYAKSILVKMGSAPVELVNRMYYYTYDYSCIDRFAFNELKRAKMVRLTRVKGQFVLTELGKETQNKLKAK